MSKKNELINPGGINGTGKGVVNTNSEDFKALQRAIIEDAKKQTLEEKMKYQLISLRFQMESYVSENIPNKIITSGEFLKKHLVGIGVKNKEFAKYTKIEESNLSSILKGRRKINIDLAYKLGEIFNINPNLWLLIQSKNELLKIDEARKQEYKTYTLKDLLNVTV